MSTRDSISSDTELIYVNGAWIPRSVERNPRHLDLIALERELMEMRLRIARLEKLLGESNQYAGCDPEVEIDIRNRAYWDMIAERMGYAA